MAVQTQTETDSGPDLLLHWQERPDSRTFFREAAASFVINVVLFALAILVNSIPTELAPSRRVEIDLHQAVHLVAPRFKELTQKEPNKGEVPKEVNVEGLMAKRAIQPSLPQPPKTFHPPAPPPPAPIPAKTPQILPEPPKLDAHLPIAPPQFGFPDVPAPKTQSQQPPKLAFETPGQNGATEQRIPGQARIPLPKNSLNDAIESVVRGGANGPVNGTIVGDEDQMPSPIETLRQPPQPGRLQSSLQLISDAQGVDFKPYLIQVLSIVKRNWLAIIPESARMGRRGKVLVQFIVDRRGYVPKLVIAMPSGTEAFDKAAVAGVSASTPLPSFPAEFKGTEVRLQFAFTYNMK